MITSPAPDLDCDAASIGDAVDTGISTGVTAGAGAGAGAETGAETGAQVCDVIDGDTTRLDDLTALFVEHFPQRAASAEQLRRNALADDECPRFRAHQYLVDVGGQPAGMICFCYSPHHDMGLLELIAVRADRRGQIIDGCRLPEWLIRQAVAQLRRDAARAMRPMPACLCAEVEPAPLVRRFCEFGFIEFPVAYCAPVFDGPRDAGGPIRQPAARFEPRHLGAFPADPNLALLKTPAWVTPRLVVDALLMVYLDYYRLSDTHPAVRQALLSIRDLHPREAARRA